MVNKIVIYGAGNNGIRLYKWLMGLNLEYLVYAFCDRNYENIVLPWKDIKIVPYETLKEGNYVFLLSVEKNEDIKKMLVSNNQEFYVCFEDFCKKYF